MINNYRVLLTNKDIYKEIELGTDISSLRIGTSIDSNIRFDKEVFFEEFYLKLERQEETWALSCSDNIYIYEGDIRKLLSRELQHGDNIQIRYNSTDNQLLALEFALDFEQQNKNYDCVFDVSDIEKINIGGKPGSDILFRNNLVGRDYMSLRRSKDVYYVEDHKSKYGIFLNGNKISGETIVHENDFISIADFSFFFKDKKLYGPQGSDIKASDKLKKSVISHSKSALEYPKFNRNSRVRPVIPDEMLPILDPPAKPQKATTDILVSLLPMLGMVVVVVIMSMVMDRQGGYMWMSVAMMSMGAIAAIVSIFSNKRKYKKGIKERIEKYNEYIDTKRKEFDSCRAKELEILTEVYKDQVENLNTVFDFSGELFDRATTDDDFLFVHLGVGLREAPRKIDFKKKESFATDDDLVHLPEQISEEYKLIENAPITLDLKGSNAVGVVGKEPELFELIKLITVDLCTRQFYDDVKLFYVIDESQSSIFNGFRFSPHIYNDHTNSRNIAFDPDSRMALFEYLYKEFSNRLNSKDKTGMYNHFIIFLLQDVDFLRHPVSKFLEMSSKIGVTFIFLDREREFLPQHCDEIIIIGSKENAKLLKSFDRNKTSSFHYSPIPDEALEKCMMKLSPVYCEEVSLEASLTKNISLFELLSIYSVDDINLGARWSNSRVDKTMAAPLGVKTKNEILSLDLHEKAHGPHGLVAGTTGSGKSEILQSYILSAATLFHPYDIAFVIIDFKGGGMVNQFNNLPHLVGAITNIDGKEVNSSLLSIKAELTKRQSLFAEADVNHIDKYIAKFKSGKMKTALPHLVIIVDEFAELKAEQPEFMKELISAARIGRSLGVHLILATQKPAGQVNEQIWSNSRFKLCLKVQTLGDSNEVLKSPLAAEIIEPGRAYFQVGNNEIFELFQSAYSGASEKVEAEGSKAKDFYLAEVNLFGQRNIVYEKKAPKQEGESRTQLTALVEYINQYCRNYKIEKLPDICLPALPKLIDYPGQLTQSSKKNAFSVDIGLYDDPRQQYQGSAYIDIAEGNTIIIGSPQYGKTNLLQCVIRNLVTEYSPDEVNLYVMDFASMSLKVFESLNHVGGVVTASEDEKLRNLFKLLNEEIRIRKERLISAGVSSFSAYKEAGQTDMPLIVSIVDNFTMLKELYLQDEDPLMEICREGLSVGISVIIANSQTAGFGFRYLSNFANRIALYNNDSGEYNNLFDHCKMRPENLPGRCLIEIEKEFYECQTYLALDGKKEIDRANTIREMIKQINTTNGNKKAKRIPEIPAALTLQYIEKNYNIRDEGYTVTVGLDYETIEPVRFQLAAMGMLGIVSQGENDVTFAKHMINRLLENKKANPVEVDIVDNFEKQFENFEGAGSVKYTSVASDILTIIDHWFKELSERYEALVSGEHDLDKQPLLTLFINSEDAIHALSESRETLGKYQEIISRYKTLKTLIVFTAVENAAISFKSLGPLRTLKEDGSFLYFGNLAALKATESSHTVAKRYKKPVEKGDAYHIKEANIVKLKTIDP